METLTTLFIQLLCGVIGANLTGILMKSLSLRVLGNTLAGLVGGLLGAQMLKLPVMGNSMLASVLLATLGGAVLVVIFGIARKLRDY